MPDKEPTKEQADLFGAIDSVHAADADAEEHTALQIVLVCVPADLGLLSYGVPPELRGRALPGHRVTVPLRGKLVVGVVWRQQPPAELSVDPARLRSVVSVNDEQSILNEPLRQTIDFIARYYHCSPGMALRTCLPAPLRRTGIQGDKTPAKMTWWAAAESGAHWPLDMARRKRRLLERLLALGETPVAALRKRYDAESGTFKSVSVPQTFLEDLAKAGLIRLWQERVLRDPLGLRAAVARDEPPRATEEQLAAVGQIAAAVKAQAYAAFVLRGVTGSGKTEVYMRVIGEALAAEVTAAQAKPAAIVMVPEIALTPQLVNRFRARFGEKVAVLHSALSDGERFDQLTRIATGMAQIVIGPRSALFAPVQRLSVVILDECHDASFKQQNGVRYHARDVALVLARAAGGVCLLGSATPGVRELHLCETGRAERIDMHRRVHGRPLPQSELVDLRHAERLRDPEMDRPSLLSVPLVEAIEATVARGEQAIILHNRRGFATTVVCAGCGDCIQCPDCAVSLTVHRRQQRMRCHYCDHSEPLEQSCRACGHAQLLHVGAGTERLEQTLAECIPGLTVQRFDRDTASGRRLIRMLNDFRAGQIDVLVGTQMLAKGHDFPSVTLVGVALAETGLRVPDFLAAERTFQLLTQVAGRAGRGSAPGRVIVQTYAPDHPAIAMALKHDHAAFCEWELKERQRYLYPPFNHLALIETRDKVPQLADSAAQRAVAVLRHAGVEVRGPVAAGVAKVRGIFRFHALVRSPERPPLHYALRLLRHRLDGKLPNSTRLTIDIDPSDFS